MKDKKPFKVGDKTIDFGQVYRIFKIKKKKDVEDKEEKIIHFRPYFRTKQNKTSSCSIPVKNIGLTHIRRPISKRKLKELLKSLSKKPETKKPINTKKVRNTLNLNKAQKTAQVLKRIWLDKNDESTNFTKAKRDILDSLMKGLVEEVAFVFGISVAQARKKIKGRLKRLGNEQNKA